jgi:hypothetical protein
MSTKRARNYFTSSLRLAHARRRKLTREHDSFMREQQARIELSLAESEQRIRHACVGAMLALPTRDYTLTIRGRM